MKVHLIHGIHTGPSSRVEGLIPYLHALNLKVCYPDYGWILGVETRVLNPTIIGTMLPYVDETDILIGHSNGCAIAYEVMKQTPVAGAVFINAALEQTIIRPPSVNFIDVYFNKGDTITEVAKLGAELGILDPVWGEMGHAGYKGVDPNISNIDCAADKDMPTVFGHSDFFTPTNLAAWGPFLAKRLAARLG